MISRLINKIFGTAGIRYLIIAGSVSIFYISLLAIFLSVGIHYYLSILISQSIAIFTAFPIYRKFVFESNGSITKDFLKFLGVWSAGAFAGFALTPFLVEIFFWDPLVAQIFAIAAISILTFFVHRFFTFASGLDSK